MTEPAESLPGTPPRTLGKFGNFAARFSAREGDFSLQPCAFPAVEKRQKNDPDGDVWRRRHDRERMRAALRKLVFAGALPSHGVSGCRVRAVPPFRYGKKTGFSGLIELRHHREQASVHHYHGRRTCRSLLVCPDCAAEFGPFLRERVQAGTRRLLAAGYFCFMLTLTAQHGRETPLAELSAGFQDAKRWMTAHKTWKMIRQHLGIIGEFSALEVTDDAPEAPSSAQTGFHWHQHLLLFYRPVGGFRGWFSEKTAGTIERRLRRLWQRALRRFGLDCSLEHGARLSLPRRRGVEMLQDSGAGFEGCDPASAQAAALYVSKGLSWEMTGSAVATKQGRRGERSSMWDILRRIADGDAALIPRYAEYMAAVRGRSFLRWSQGLAQFCGMPEDEAALLDDAPRVAGDVVDYAWSDRAFSSVARAVQETAIRRIADEAGEDAPEAVARAMRAINSGCDPLTGEELPPGTLFRGRALAGRDIGL